ncbi:unnamed protein product [Symbiodinium pilosum]|uniref:Uncharacterized protein n=1 Tax=Symbiodinium pilosum TaxID=2952 RepID=A0A812WWA6_SYMPI|nr:unnamed protein product [Symbiodinium pilosum]
MPYQPTARSKCHTHYPEEGSPCSSPSLVSVAGDDMLTTRPLQPAARISPPPGLKHLGSPAPSEAEARPWSMPEPLLPSPRYAYLPQVVRGHPTTPKLADSATASPSAARDHDARAVYHSTSK